jgi:PPOX class probable F420-dependent enzyme
VSRSYTLEDEHLEFWREKHHCAVTSLKQDGSPHVVPMGVVVDPDAGLAFAITSGRSQKVANLRRDPRIAVCQVDRGRWSTIEGTAEVMDDAESVADAVRRYAERYRTPRENPERVALRITISRVIGNV